MASSGWICSDTALTSVTAGDYEKLLGLDNVNVGAISLVKLTAGAVTTDSAYALLQQLTGQQVNLAVFQLQPSIGSCISFVGGGPSPYFGLSPIQLNAGPQINLHGPDGAPALVPGYPTYSEPVGTSRPIIPTAGGVFMFTNGSGGPDVGPFTATHDVNLATPLVWTIARMDSRLTGRAAFPGVLFPFSDIPPLKFGRLSPILLPITLI